MSDINVIAVTGEQYENASVMMLPEVSDLLAKGMPMTVLAAVMDNVAVGVLAGMADTETQSFLITSLYVHPDYRRKGAGRELVWKLEDILDEADEHLIIKAEYTLQTPDNMTLRPFFTDMGFRQDRVNFPAYYVTDVEDIRISDNSNEGNEHIQSFDGAPDMLLKAAANRSIGDGLELPEGGLTAENIDRETSYCVLDREKINAFIAVENLDEELLRIPALWSELKNPKEMIKMIESSFKGLKEKYPPETKTAMLATNATAYKLIQYLFKGAEPVSYTFVRM